MSKKPVTQMTFEEWMERVPRFRFQDEFEMEAEADATDAVDRKLAKAVAYHLYVASKDAPNDEAGVLRAAALALINKPIDAALLREAGHWKSDDDPLYENDICVKPAIADLWAYFHRVEIDAIYHAALLRHSAGHAEEDKK